MFFSSIHLPRNTTAKVLPVWFWFPPPLCRLPGELPMEFSRTPTLFSTPRPCVRLLVKIMSCLWMPLVPPVNGTPAGRLTRLMEHYSMIWVTANWRAYWPIPFLSRRPHRKICDRPFIRRLQIKTSIGKMILRFLMAFMFMGVVSILSDLKTIPSS